MSDDDRTNYSADPDLAGKPITRFELWQACQMLRSLSLNVYIHDLAHQVSDHAEVARSSKGVRESQAKLDEFLDTLIGLKASDQ